MSLSRRIFAAALLGGLLSVPCVASITGYIQTNLVSDGAVPANHLDADLKNPWGISFGPSTPFWVSDNGTGKATIYRGDGTQLGLVVTIPPPPGSAPGDTAAPTGTVFNDTSGFLGDRFLFASEDGTITGWQGSLGTTAAIRVDRSAADNVYKGLAINGNRIYATDFHNGRVAVFDSNYSPVSLSANAFLDPNLPAGYAPFGIQNINGSLYVTFAQREAGGDDDVHGPGFGFVDKFNADGTLLQRLIVGSPGNPNSPLNAPWGLALAPASFGELSGKLLVGNFGDGRINAFDPTNGIFVDAVRDVNGSPIMIDGLWGIAFGNTGPHFDPNKLYFTAGLNDEENGLFGSLRSAVPEPGYSVLVGCALMLLGVFRRLRFRDLT
jgi:uncharacterized protein (TIGR03118 family)